MNSIDQENIVWESRSIEMPDKSIHHYITFSCGGFFLGNIRCVTTLLMPAELLWMATFCNKQLPHGTKEDAMAWIMWQFEILVSKCINEE